MKKATNFKYYVFIIFIINIISLKSEDFFDFTGYVYNLPSYQDLPRNAEIFGYNGDEKYFLMDLTRLRLMPNFNITEDSRITLHYELDFLASKVAIPYYTSSGKTNRQAVNLYWKLIGEDKFKVNHFIDLLYYKHIFDFGEITFGRQLISWGVGRIWQPTDLFNPINPANFSKFEKDGADCISSKIFLGDFTDLELVVNFREKLDKTNYGARFRTNYEEFDLTLNTGVFDNNYVIGASFAGNLFGAGVRGEGIINTNKDSSYSRFILGADYQFTSKLYALVEYLYNGEGTSCKLCYDIIRLFKGEILNASKNYISVQGNYQIHPLISLTFVDLTNLNDKSGYVSGMARYNALENLNLGLGTMFFYGNDLTEYSYYSTAAYLLFQYYF